MKYITLLSLLFALLAIPINFVTAEEEGHTCLHGCVPGKYEMVTITGINYCPFCELKHELGAEADCKTYGHRNAVKISKLVDFCGDEKSEFNGQTYFYLENEKSIALVKDLKDKKVELKCKLYLDVTLVEVISYNIIEG